MDMFENISNDIQSQYENIEHFLKVDLKEGIDKLNKETIKHLSELIKNTEKIPNNIFDTFRRTDSSNNGIYNPYSD